MLLTEYKFQFICDGFKKIFLNHFFIPTRTYYERVLKPRNRSFVTHEFLPWKTPDAKIFLLSALGDFGFRPRRREDDNFMPPGKCSSASFWQLWQLIQNYLLFTQVILF